MHSQEVRHLCRCRSAGDGLLTAVRLAAFEVLDQRSILFNDCADRVALLLRLRLRATPTPRCRPGLLVCNKSAHCKLHIQPSLHWQTGIQKQVLSWVSDALLLLCLHETLRHAAGSAC